VRRTGGRVRRTGGRVRRTGGRGGGGGGGGGGGYRTKNKNPTRQCGEKTMFFIRTKHLIQIFQANINNHLHLIGSS